MAIKRLADVSYDKTIKMMIYGQAGFGKSTLALSCPNPVYMDFDGSGKRLSYVDDNQPTIYPTDWMEIKTQLTTDAHELAPFSSIVVDTIGKMMDMIISYKCGNKIPRIQDWQGINQEFSWFMRTLTDLKKNVIIVAQRTTRDEGDKVVFVPALRQKNLDAIITELDLLGYVDKKEVRGQQKRIITFDPTSQSEGKNTCNLKAEMEVPTINSVQANNFITTQIIAPYHEMLKAKEEANKAYKDALNDITTRISNIANADEANMFVDYMKTTTFIGNIKAIALGQLNAKTTELGLTYNKTTKQYESVA